MQQEGEATHEPDWDDNGQKYLAQYGLTSKHMTSLNLFLQDFMVGPQGMTDVAKGLVENWSLTSLELRKQDIGREGAVALGQALKQNRYLKYLGLGRNRLGSEGCISIMEGLRMNPTLECLDVEWNEIRDEGAIAIGEMLKYNNSLQTIILERNKVKSRGAVAIAEALVQNEKLRHLNLGYNKVANSGAIAFAQALRDNDSMLTLSLYLNEIRKEGGVAFAESLRFNETLQSINLQNNRIGESAALLGEVLQDNTTLREMNLQQTGIDESMAAALGQGLLKNRCLMSINLAGNIIGNQGMRQILSGLKGQTSLRYLDISNTGLEGMEAMEDVCELVELGGNLEMLQLDNNKLGKRSIVMLCTRLERNVVLHTLNVDRTDMGREGAGALGIALKKKSYWVSLSLAGNHIGSEGAKAVCAGLKCLSTLAELDMSDNDITSSADDAIYAVLKANKDLLYVRLKGNEIARDLQSGVLTRAIAEDAIGAPEALSGAASHQGISSLPPVPIRDRAVTPPMGTTGSLPSGGTYQPSTNFAVTHRLGPYHTSDYTPTANTTSAYQDTSFAPMVGTRRRLAPATPASTIVPSSTVSLPRALTPTFQPQTTPYKAPPIAGLSPLSFTGALSPQRTTQTSHALRRLENNIGGLLLSEDQLRRRFNRLDRNGNGWLDRTEFKREFVGMENFGVVMSPQQVEDALGKSTFFGDSNRISFEQYCVIMWGIARR